MISSNKSYNARPPNRNNFTHNLIDRRQGNNPLPNSHNPPLNKTEYNPGKTNQNADCLSKPSVSDAVIQSLFHGNQSATINLTRSHCTGN